MSLKETTKISANRYQLEITVDAERFNEAIRTAYRQNGSKINVPGFRRGKAPLSIVEKMYGAEVFFEDALNVVYPEMVEDAINASGLKVLDDKMDFDLVSVSKEEGADFKVSVTTYPEIEIGEYKGLSAERPSAKVEDSEIQQEIDSMAQRNSRTVTVEDRAAQNGDIAVIDYEGFVDGKAFDGGKDEGHSLTLGSGQFIPGFEEQVIGHNAGDEFDITVTFPEEYGSEDLAGKEAVFKIKLHEIKFTELPAIDDEFAKDVSEFDTLDALKADLMAKAVERKTKAADEAVENELIKQIAEGLTGEIPEVMFENRMEASVKDFSYRLQSQGMNLETYLKYTGSTIEDFKKSFRPQVESQVKARLALEKITELENIQVSDDELEAEYKKLSEAYGVELDRVKAGVNPDDLKADIASGKAIDIVKSSAVITEASEKKPEKATAKKSTAAKKTTAKKTENTDKADEEADKPVKKTTRTTTKKSAEKAAVKDEKADK